MSIFPRITTKKELVFYLIKQENPYTRFILQHLTHQTFEKFDLADTELPHIIPLHANGVNKKWNLICLSIQDHQQAHRLLYEVYKSPNDLYALRFRMKMNKEAYKLRIQLSHNSQRVNKNGFFNSETQRSNGHKGGSVKSNKKRLTYRSKVNLNWEEVCNNESFWLYKKTNFLLKINAYECFLPQEVASKLLTYKPFRLSYTAKIQSLASCLSRVVNQERKSASGWVLLKKS